MARAAGPIVAVRPLETGDAESLVACFRRCYGGTHVAQWLDDPALARARVREGREHSVVAVRPSGEVVGHMALKPGEPGALAAELGTTFVDPDCRGEDLSARMSAALVDRCRELGLVGFVHYPTTAHPAMQKIAQKAGGATLGVLLDYIPAETGYLGFEAASDAQRTSVVAVYHPLSRAPARAVRIPARHRELARTIYAQASLTRDLQTCDPALPRGDTRLVARLQERRGLLRIELRAIGADLRDCVDRALARHPGVPALLDLQLCEHAIEAAVEVLAGADFFFGALLPEHRADGDVLTLQYLPDDPVEPQLETDSARRLFAYTSADRRRGGRA